METLHTGLELYSLLGRRWGSTPTGAWQVVSSEFKPRGNWDFKWYWYSDTKRCCTATLSVATCSASGHLWRRVCRNILSAQCRGWRHLESIARRRLYLPKSRIESTNIHSKITTLSTDESDQTVSQCKTIHNGSVVPLPSHLCGPHWPTSERRGRIPAYTGSDLCVLTLDRTFSN